MKRAIIDTGVIVALLNKYDIFTIDRDFTIYRKNRSEIIAIISPHSGAD